MFYIDDLHLLTQKNDDAGDCCNETGVYYFGLWVQKYILGLDIDGFPLSQPIDFLNALNKLEVQKGVLTRHPRQFPDPFRKDWVTSRDQVSPIVMALGLWMSTHGNMFTPNMIRIRNYHRDRKRTVPFLWQYPNDDVAGPEQISYYNRAFNTGGVYAGDVQLYGSSVVRCLNNDPDNVGDDRIHSMSLIYAQVFRPTWIGGKALEYYKANRPPNHGTVKLGESNNIQGAWSWYYRPDSGNISEIGDKVYRPIIAKYFS